MSSPALYIRDQTLSRITSLYRWKTVRKVPSVTTQADHFPRLGVYLVRESEDPDGDANVLEPRYIATTIIGISVMDALSKPEVLEGSVDSMIDNIKNTLLGDSSFVSLKWSDGVTFLIDSIPNITRTYNYPNSGDSYYIECRLQVTFRYFVHYPPSAPNAFQRMEVTIAPEGDTAALPPADQPFIITIPQ